MRDVFMCYRELNYRLTEKGQAALMTRWNGKPGEQAQVSKQVLENTKGMAVPKYEQKENSFSLTEFFLKRERLILLGGGHVSLSLAEFAAQTGFQVTVVDDRSFFANRERFSCASEIICDEFSHAIDGLKISSLDYIVILTRGHRYDRICIEALSHQPLPYYLGMLGSRTRVGELKKALLKEGINPRLIEMLNAPVGLEIGAVTPEEIAVSILAQLIRYRRVDIKGDQGHLKEKSDIDLMLLSRLEMLQEDRKNLPCGIVTVLKTKGSTPRKAGTKMIVYSDGHTAGTIGGGYAEAMITERTKSLLGKNTYEIFRVDMTGKEAKEDGMLCGGTMEVLIECFIADE